MFYSIHSHDMLDRIEENIDLYLNNSKNFVSVDTESHKECSICLEKYLGNIKEPPSQLSFFIDNVYYDLKKTCTCDSFVHQNCLGEWLSKSASCFICRKKFFVIATEEPDIVHNNFSTIQNRLSNVIYCLQGFHEASKIAKTVSKIIIYSYLSYTISKTFFGRVDFVFFIFKK